ncbi:MAG: hypothetical protein JWO89_1024 [Verrucomicrobiaceae bacterium]|nr:hypothetical protein [Verrucomicrobiaceae bacterium]MDB6116513.1 hypothetical protein [Verrucomicrobiaceae bacterium]
MTGVLIFAWRVHVNRADYDWTEYPTALGDKDYYQPFSANDLYAPVLKVPGHRAGLYRRMVKPVKRSDARMTKVGRDATGKVFVYADTKKKPGSPERLFVKAADDQYLEFGARKFWPPFRPEGK